MCWWILDERWIEVGILQIFKIQDTRFAHVCNCTLIVRSRYDVVVVHDLRNLLDDTLDSGWKIKKIISLIY
jgi:hypothetical protein